VSLTSTLAASSGDEILCTFLVYFLAIISEIDKLSSIEVDSISYSAFKAIAFFFFSISSFSFNYLFFASSFFDVYR